MKYASDPVILSSTVGLVHYYFHSNSIYDPDGTGLGHQPYYRDQLSVLYNRYRVHSVTVKLTGKCLTDTCSVVALYARSYSSVGPISFLQEIMEKQIKPKVIKKDEIFTMSKTWKIRDIESLSKSGFDAVLGYSGSTGGNPTFMPRIYCSAAAYDEVTASTVILRAELSFNVEYYDLLTIAPS